MCREARQGGRSPVTALQYLQTQVAEVVGPDDGPAFERLSALLFGTGMIIDHARSNDDEAGVDVERWALYEEIATHFAPSRRPPAVKIQDLLV